MAFSFNFDVKVQTDECCQGDAKAGNDQEHCLKTVEDDRPLPLRPLKAACEHTLPTKLESLLCDVVTETVCVGSLPCLLCVNESVLERTAAEEEEEQEEEEEEEERALLRRMKAAPQRSDLVPGVYEGGLRVWECTYDLLAHLERGGGVAFSGRRVLDLGCGAGLLGVMAMRLGAEEVHFQDYNSSVIRWLTMPNAVLNQQPEGGEGEEEQEEQEGEEQEGEEEEQEEEGEEQEEEGEEQEEEERQQRDKRENRQKKEREVQKQKRSEEERRRKRRGEGRAEGCDSPPSKRKGPAPPASGPARCRFFSGDWASFLAMLRPLAPAHKYDIILTSETIYNTAYYPALHEVFRWLLAHDGQVLLATKAHYFGVGGGLLLFERFVEERGVFQMRRLLDVDEGLQRHVVSLTFRRQNTRNTHGSLHNH